MEAIGTGCGIGCLLGLVLAPVLAVVLFSKQRRAKRLAWQIIQRGGGDAGQIDNCIAVLSVAEDHESRELVRRLMDLKAGSAGPH
jgi:hypothetical protein